MACKSILLIALVLASVIVPAIGFPKMASRDVAVLKQVRKDIKHKKYFPAAVCGNTTVMKRGITFFGCDDKGHVTDMYCNAVPWGGILSSFIGKMPNLVRLTILSCRMWGNLPNELGNISTLRSLTLEYNYFGGSIPSGITNLKSLRTLSLASNLFTGTLPATLGNMAKLQDASFSANKLVGGIPASVKNLTSLNSLFVDRNYMTGPMITQNGHPGCKEAQRNCFVGKNLPCKGKHQRTKEECDAFYKKNPL